MEPHVFTKSGVDRFGWRATGFYLVAAEHVSRAQVVLRKNLVKTDFVGGPPVLRKTPSTELGSSDTVPRARENVDDFTIKRIELAQ